jgi:predicted RNase H-like HicB family nuclease
MAKNIVDYLKEPYARIVVPEHSSGYFAEILEFPGCLATGDTPGEAYENLEGVAVEWIEAEIEKGHEIPPPSSSDSFSGKFALRMPSSLHQQAARMAEREGISLNQYINAAIAMRTGADDLLRRVTEKMRSITVNATFHIGGSAVTGSEQAWTGIPGQHQEIGNTIRIGSGEAGT